MRPPPDAPASRAALLRRLRAPRDAYVLWALEDESGRLLVRWHEGRAAVVSSEDAPPDARLRGASGSLDAFLAGALPLEAGLATGRISVDHLGHGRALARWAAAARPAPAPPAPPRLPRGRWVGRPFAGGSAVVHPDHILAYADATDDPSVTYRGADAIAPPMLHARLFRDELFALMQDPTLQPDFARVLHVGHDLTLRRPLRPWEVVQRRGGLTHVAQKGGGLLFSGVLVGLVAGAEVLRAHTTFFVPGQRVDAPGVSEGSPPPEPPAAPERPPDLTLEWAMSADQAARYAAASLDDNPLHTSPEAAAAAGQPGCPVHGLCTLARAGQGVVQRLAFGDPRGLRRLAGRFVAPVFGGDALRTRVWRTPGGAAFSVHAADGSPVLTHGLVTLDP